MSQHQMTLAEFRQQLAAYPTNWLMCKDTAAHLGR